jgi:hypothetical protein
MRRTILWALYAAVAGCGAAQPQAESVGDPALAAEPATPLAPAASASPPPSAPEPAPLPNPPPEKEPPPLRAATGTPTAPGTSKSKATCDKDTVRQKLQQVVGECKKSGAKICGELKVRASDDGKSVKVALDVAKDSFDDAFSRCVTSQMNSVQWQCTLPGSDVSLDLGCDL